MQNRRDWISTSRGASSQRAIRKRSDQRPQLLHLCNGLFLEKGTRGTERKVMVSLLECLAGGLRCFNGLIEWGTPWPGPHQSEKESDFKLSVEAAGAPIKLIPLSEDREKGGGRQARHLPTRALAL